MDEKTKKNVKCVTYFFIVLLFCLIALVINLMLRTIYIKLKV